MSFLQQVVRDSPSWSAKLSPAAYFSIGADVVFDCDGAVLAEQSGDTVTIVYDRTCGHVGMVQLQASSIHGIEEAFHALKAAGTPAPCFCLHPVHGTRRA